MEFNYHQVIQLCSFIQYSFCSAVVKNSYITKCHIRLQKQFFFKNNVTDYKWKINKENNYIVFHLQLIHCLTIYRHSNSTYKAYTQCKWMKDLVYTIIKWTTVRWNTGINSHDMPWFLLFWLGLVFVMVDDGCQIKVVIYDN